MIIKMDPIQRIIYLSEPTSLGELEDTLYELTGDAGLEEDWILVPETIHTFSLS